MSLCCRLLLLRSTTQSLISHRHPLSPLFLLPLRSFAFSSAEEATAERRRRKRRLRIEPPVHSICRENPAPRPPPDPNAPRLPDTTSSLVGPRLNLHNRVQSLIRAGDLDGASSVARNASRPRPTVFTCNAVVTAMYRVKRYDDAVALFRFFFERSNIVPNVVSYNVLINTHCDCGRVDKALEVYRHITENAPFSPSAVTFRHLTKGLIDYDRIGEAVDLLREMLMKGHGADSLVYNNLIKGFLDLGNLERANELFDELKERCLVYDGVVNATFMDWYFSQGKEKEAMESYRSLLDRKFRMTPATCNVLLECLLRNGRKKDAWILFDTMLDNHTPPNFQAVNSDTFSIMVNECFKLGKFSEAVETFRRVGIKVNSKPFSMDVAGYNNIIVRFADHGMVEEAEKFFEELRSKSLSPDVTGYRTLIDSYFKQKKIDDAVQMFQQMVDANLRVIPLYANKCFGELIDNDKALESSQILMKMGEREPKPDFLTYEIVIKGLCYVGAFDQCKEIINQMMGYSVDVSSSLREFLIDAFEKQGKKDEIERLLFPRRHVLGSHSQPSKPQTQIFPPSSVPPGSVHAGVVRSLDKPRHRAETIASQTPAGPIGQWATAGFSGATKHAEYSGPSYQVGYQTGSVVSQTPAEPLRQGENAGFAGSYGSSMGSSSAGATGFVGSPVLAGYTGSAHQSTSQSGLTGLSGKTENHIYHGTNEPAGFPSQVGSTGYPNQYAPQSCPTGPRGDANYTRNHIAYESSRFSAEIDSKRFSEPAENGGRPEYTQYAVANFAAQRGGPFSSQDHTVNAGFQSTNGDYKSYARGYTEPAAGQFAAQRGGPLSSQDHTLNAGYQSTNGDDESYARVGSGYS